MREREREREGGRKRERKSGREGGRESVGLRKLEKHTTLVEETTNWG